VVHDQNGISRDAKVKENLLKILDNIALGATSDDFRLCRRERSVVLWMIFLA
jgi:hypothetical protein